MTEQTIAFDGAGWPSFYSFIPEYMIGMRNKFYSFKGGNIFEHSGPVNTFYGTKHNSSIVTVINDEPLTNKLFKAIGLHSTDAWDTNMETDIQLSGIVAASSMEKKEGVFFGYIKETGVLASAFKFESRVNGGIGVCTLVQTDIPTYRISFDRSSIFNLGSSISVGDYLYFINSSDDIVIGGVIFGFSSPGDTTTYIDVTIDGAGQEIQEIPTGGAYIMFMKSSQAESSGLLGHYCKVTMECSPSEDTELFAIEADVMKSYP